MVIQNVSMDAKRRESARIPVGGGGRTKYEDQIDGGEGGFARPHTTSARSSPTSRSKRKRTTAKRRMEWTREKRAAVTSSTRCGQGSLRLCIIRTARPPDSHSFNHRPPRRWNQHCSGNECGWKRGEPGSFGTNMISVPRATVVRSLIRPDLGQREIGDAMCHDTIVFFY